MYGFLVKRIKLRFPFGDIIIPALKQLFRILTDPLTIMNVNDMVQTEYGTGIVTEIRDNDILVQLGIASVSAFKRKDIEVIGSI